MMSIGDTILEIRPNIRAPSRSISIGKFHEADRQRRADQPLGEGYTVRLDCLTLTSIGRVWSIENLSSY